MTPDYVVAPVDPISAESLAAQGLRLELVDTSDAEAFGTWLVAESRGFHDSRPDAASLARQVAGLAYRRTTGAYDPALDEPVGTVSTWPVELTVPGERSVTSWAISAVTVSPTHRRRGVARALIEAELRTAASLGVPVAMLTVSEATIYGRYGFSPAALAATWTIDPRRAKWIGPVASGRVRFVTAEQLLVDGPQIVERVRLRSPGEIVRWEFLWRRMLQLDDREKAKKLRTVRYDDEHGTPQGFALYTVTENQHAFNTYTLDVEHLITATDDAYAGLWRFLLENDLLSEVTASMRPVIEPLFWQVSDSRAVRKTEERDHQWVRIIDVAAALTTRAYAGAEQIVLEVSDPLGFADGIFLLDIAADGMGRVSEVTGEVPDAAAALALTVEDLASLYLGGVAADTLVRAGRVVELRPGSAHRFDAAARSTATPWLSIWY